VGQVQQVFRRDSIFTGHMDQDTGTGTPGRLCGGNQQTNYSSPIDITLSET